MTSSRCVKFSRKFLCCRRFYMSLAYKEHIPQNAVARSNDDSSLSSPVVIAHGLLGSKTNWSVVASSLATSIQQKVYVVDVRNHGESPHSDTMSYEVMADDLVEFTKDRQWKQVSLIGHSMGGKVAMCVALREPSLVERLVVVDVTPSHSKNGEQLKSLMEAMQSVDVKGIISKTQADEMLQTTVPEDGVRHFLLTNLVKSRGSDGFYWKCNLPLLYKRLPQLLDFPQFSSTFTGKTIFVSGSKSGVIGDEEMPNIKQLFSMAEVVSLDTGHWVHAEKPQEFSQIVAQFLTTRKI